MLINIIHTRRERVEKGGAVDKLLITDGDIYSFSIDLSIFIEILVEI